MILNFLKNYFAQPVEYYFYINAIPDYKFFGHSDHFYFYIFLFISLVLLILFFYWRRYAQSDFFKTLLYFVLIFWLITSLRWLIIEGHWLKNDWQELGDQSIFDRRSIMFGRLAASVDLPLEWAEFYDFLEFTKNEIPAGSTVYLLPDHPYFKIFARYWLYPQVRLIERAPADYLLAFNIRFETKPDNYQVFKGFSPTAFIFKYSPKDEIKY